MQLSKRLQMVTKMVRESDVTADVGCDHAYVSIALVQEERAKQVIAMDVNEGPYERAQENIRRSGFGDRISLRLSDGLEQLVPREADTIVIAGMGGILGISILEKGEACVQAARILVLQLQSELSRVREYLSDTGMEILEEDMCYDDGKYYTVLRVSTRSKKQYPNRIQMKFGAYLLKHKHPVLRQYISSEQKKALQLMEQLQRNDSEGAKERIQTLQEEINEFQEALSYYA